MLVDINLPRMSGIELVARLKALPPSTLCLVLTMYEEKSLIFDALKVGACGYLLKRTPPAEIVTAIEQVHSGGTAMSPQIARQVVTFFIAPRCRRPRAWPHSPSGNARSWNSSPKAFFTRRSPSVWRSVSTLRARVCGVVSPFPVGRLELDTARARLRKV